MPRRKVPGAPEPKSRSRFGCWPCKRRRIKCGEERPVCHNCDRLGDTGCDYTLKLNWDARSTAPSSASASAPAASNVEPEASTGSATFHARTKSVKSKRNKFIYLYDGQGDKRKLDGSYANSQRALPGSNAASETRRSTSSPAKSTPTSSSVNSSTPSTSSKGVYAGFGQRSVNIDPLAIEESIFYGYDQGRPDLDVSRNDDANALRVSDPDAIKTPLRHHGQQSEPHGNALEYTPELYYAEPVPVRIPKSLGALPPLLMDNPMNLLYFHFFINHTAQVLVPCSCSANLLRIEVPRMALKNDALLKLLVVFAAHHRARLLHKPYPKARIAMLVTNVFTILRNAMTGKPSLMTDEHICTALFLATLEVIDMNAFDTPMLGWEEHLSLALECVRIRGGIDAVRGTNTMADFLMHWAGYLDVLGALSSPRYPHPLVGSGMRCIMEEHPADCGHPAEKLGEDGEIECYLGFTDRSMNYIAEIAHLIQSYTPGRLKDDGTADPAWRPSRAVVERANHLIQAMNAAKKIKNTPCPGNPNETRINGAAITRAYHEGGLLHLYRRVLNLPRASPEVQESVATIVACLEACEDRSLLFMSMPLCTAGFEALQDSHRQLVVACLNRIDRLGFSTSAMDITLCMRVWESGLNWERFYEGQYLG